MFWILLIFLKSNVHIFHNLIPKSFYLTRAITGDLFFWVGLTNVYILLKSIMWTWKCFVFLLIIKFYIWVVSSNFSILYSVFRLLLYNIAMNSFLKGFWNSFLYIFITNFSGMHCTNSIFPCIDMVNRIVLLYCLLQGKLQVANSIIYLEIDLNAMQIMYFCVFMSIILLINYCEIKFKITLTIYLKFNCYALFTLKKNYVLCIYWLIILMQALINLVG